MSENQDIIGKSSQNQKILPKLKEIFVKLLGVNISKIDIHTHFLEMGLDSLILLQIKRAIQEQFDINIPFRLLVEDFSTIYALANHIDQQLPAEELIKIEPSLTVKASDTREFEHENNKSTGATVLEQVIAQQLELMSKQLELLQKTGSSGKVLPSPTAIQSAPFQTKEQQTTQSLTNHFVNLASTSIKAEFQEPPINQTIESQQTEKEAMALLNPHQQKHLDDLIARFVQRTQESKRLTQVYRSYHANGRAVAGFIPSFKEMLYPIHGQRGEGARLWDVDGNEYVDISMGFGALLFGHSPSFVIEVIQEQIQQGILHGPQSRLCGQVAELICKLTGAERAAFCNDGTEAVMGAIRLARATTGRSKIALFAGSYHGIYDGILVRGVKTSEGALRSIPRAIGIPSYIADDVIVLDYGQPESLEILKTHAHELAAVLVEPIQSSRPDLQPKEFLLQLRQLTQATGTVLIFDEVITGFRMHPGGIQGLWDIQADLTTYGKAVAAGMPIGVIAGKAALMDALDGGMWNYGDKSYPQAETTVFAGTFFKHPLVMATAWAALNHIKNSGAILQEELSEKTRKLADTLNNYFEQRQVPIQVVNFGSLFRFTALTPLKFGNLFFYYLLEKGIYVWEGRTLYLSTAHTDEDIEHVIRAVKESVVAMQEGEFLPPYPSSTTERESIKIPLTEAQKELWFLAQMGNEVSRAYNESRTIHLRGSFNFSALRQAVQGMINRHEALRTTFSPQGDYQLIHSSVIIDIFFSDFSALDKSEREAQLSQFLKQEAQQTFNLEQGPLLCFHIVKLEKQHHLLVITNHHIVADGWSIAILLRELATIYSAECQGIAYQLPQPMQLSEYAQWQERLQQSPEMATAEAYWLNKFANSVPMLELPTDRPRPSVNTYTGDRQSLTLGTSLFKNLKSLSVQRHTTLFTTLLAGYIALLHRLTGQDDIVVGIATAGQLSVGSEYLVGHCVNLLPVRTQISGNQTFTDFSTSVKRVLLEAYEHQIYPFIKLIKNLNLPRDPSRAPLLTTIFNMDRAGSEVESLDHKVESVKNPTSSAKYDIAFNIVETSSDLLVECDYSTDLFDSQTIQRWMEHFRILLEGIVTHPEQRLSDLPLLTQAQQHQLLVDWNNTLANYPEDRCIHELFEAQVERSPDTIAVVFEDQQLTYRELNQRANQLAHHLRKLGVEPEVLVGICTERSSETLPEASLSMIIGVLGILKAGGAYIPLDPTYPQERLAFILEDAQVQVLLTQQRLVEVMPQHKAKVICLDTNWQTIAQESQENLFSEVTSNNLAYVIYTSGSTGTPKGVQIPHSALSNFLQSMRQTPGLSEQDTLLAVTTYSFDIAALELFLPITVGARLVVLSREITSDGTRLSAKLTDSNATVMQATPATWQLLLAASWQGNHQLKILCGGEALPGQLANQLLKRCDSLWNMYGPTETTIWSAACQVEKDISVVPISQPIANTQFYILDQYAQLVPVGVPGELHIGGAGLARGYLNRPELTAEKFIPNSFSAQPAARLYKTGDLARYSPNGEIEYLGRIDHQVKVRGFRIELGEIEAHLSQHPAIRNTVVVVRDYQTDFQRIVAYVVPQKEQTLTVTELRDFLELKLLNYMVPSVFMILEVLPLTPNGKIDRKALPTPDLTQQLPQPNFVAPDTPIEEMLAGIWADILGVEKVGINENFFTLGGHSLLATRVISQMRQVFEVELPLRRLFEEPTIAGIAKDIEKAIKTGLGLEKPPIKSISRSQELSLSFAQQRLWFINQLQPGKGDYNISSAMRLFGWLNVMALEQSFNEVIRRHEILRTTFTARDGQPIQVIAPTLNFKLPLINFRELPKDKKEAEVLRLAYEEAQQPFDLANGPLLRVTLLRQTETEHVLLLTMHHIISDGWSIGVLIHEITDLYEAFSSGKPSTEMLRVGAACLQDLQHATLTPLPELSIQYADFAVWQRQWLQGEQLETQLAYWKQQLGSRLPVLELPTDRPRPAIQTFSGARESLMLPKTLSEKLKALNQRQGTTLFMILVAAFQTLLFWYTGQEDIVVGTDIANRNQAETKGLIGFFVNQLVLRTDLSGNPTFLELLERVREMTLEAYAHQDLPFDKLVDVLNPKRELNRSPLFQVKIVLNNIQTPSLKLPDLTISPLKVENKTVQFDLLLELNETDQGLFSFWKYNTDLFDTVSIVQMSRNFEALLGKIATHPEVKLSELKTILSEADKQQNLAREQVYKSNIQQKLMNVKRRANSRL